MAGGRCFAELAACRTGDQSVETSFVGQAMRILGSFRRLSRSTAFALRLLPVLLAGGCAGATSGDAGPVATQEERSYLIGSGDVLSVFVWQNPDLSVTAPVRPDGRISLPLLQDVDAAQKTPAELARDIEQGLSKYIRDPLVTVIVTEFVGAYSQQVRVIGEAAEPKAIPYRTDMSILDVMIAVGGLTQFAAGNRAALVRNVDGKQQTFAVRLDDLLRDGDMSANVPVLPGDVLVIPESWF
jgi:polysaccharide biosynthesis/export protein